MALSGRRFILTPRIEEILRTVHFYRYVTALDITYLLFSPKSITHVREILSSLSGGDALENQYLFRFPLPEFTGGKTEKVYTLGSKGRDLLVNDLRVPVDWYFRPSHARQLSHGLIVHNLTLTRFLVCARIQNKFDLADCRISYQMDKNPQFKIVPDAWLLFKKEEKNYPILLEIDRGTAYRDRLKEHIKSRVEFIRSGEYQRLFESKGCIIAYATTGQIARVNFMRACCNEVLKEMNLKNWASIFRFGAIVRKSMYSTPLFDASMWLRPDSNSPVALLGV